MGLRMCKFSCLMIYWISCWTKEIPEALSWNPPFISQHLIKSLHHLIISDPLNIVLDVLHAELRLKKEMDSFVGQQLPGVKNVSQEVCQDLGDCFEAGHPESGLERQGGNTGVSFVTLKIILVHTAGFKEYVIVNLKYNS